MKILTDIPLGFLNGDNSVAGGNYGNQVIWSSTMRLLGGHTLLDWKSEVEPDMVVLAIANAIQEQKGELVGLLADRVERLDCPKVILSIGAQNDTCEMFNFSTELRSKTERLLRQMDAVNLRGEYTRDLLRHNGIDGDFKVNGCPSILFNKIPEIPDRNEEKVVLNMPRHQQCAGLFEDLVNMSGERAVMLGQDGVYQNYSGTKKYVLSTSSIDVWRKYLDGATFSIGTRIHGSVMSLLCGVPTLCICIDSRTTELCRALSIPHTVYNGERFPSFDEFMSYARRHYLFDRSALDDSVCRMQEFFDKEVGSRLLSSVKSSSESVAMVRETGRRIPHKSVLEANIVIPTFNGMEFLPRVINAIRDQDVPFGYNIICVDSNSTDGTYEWLKGQPDIRLETTDDFQHGRTRNYGASLGNAEYIVFLTQDAIPKNDQWLYNFITVMRHYRQAAGGFGRHEAHKEHPWQKEKIDGVFRTFNDYQLCVSMSTDPVRWNDPADRGWRRFMHFYSDNNSCMRRSVWERHPYPEVEFGEDQAWADMIIKAGYSKVYVPTACVYHSHNFTSEQEKERQEIERDFFRSMEKNGLWYHIEGDKAYHAGNHEQAIKLWKIGASMGVEQCKKNIDWLKN